MVATLRHVRRRAAAAVLSAVLVSGGLVALSPAPAWAPTCGASCGMYPKPPNPPASAHQCNDGGWQNYTDAAGFAFRNQGGCVSYVASGGQSDRSPSPSPAFPGNPG
jgi:hypothetical protein